MAHPTQPHRDSGIRSAMGKKSKEAEEPETRKPAMRVHGKSKPELARVTVEPAKVQEFVYATPPSKILPLGEDSKSTHWSRRKIQIPELGSAWKASHIKVVIWYMTKR